MSEENIQELSKKKMGQYLSKSLDDIDNKNSELQDADYPTYYRKIDTRKVANRRKGIKTIAKRLTKEDANLNFVKDAELEDIIEKINTKLYIATSQKFLTPYTALQKVSKVMASFGIILPKYNFMSGDDGECSFELKRNPEASFSQNKDGSFDRENKDLKTIYLNFTYSMNEAGFTEVSAEVSETATEDENYVEIDE